MQEEPKKVFVDVLVEHTRGGRRIPRLVTFENGRNFPIDRVLSAHRAKNCFPGEAGICYSVRIGRRETFLYEEGERWFVILKTGAEEREGERA